MAETVQPATSASAPASKPAKKARAPKDSKPKTVPNHPPVAQMVKAAITSLKERNGSSLQAIKKYISSNYKVDIERLSPFIRKHLKSAVTKGLLVQSKGKGASGSFKLRAKENIKPRAEKKTSAKKSTPKKPRVEVAKSAKVKKPREVKPASARPKKAPAAKKPKVEKKSKIPKSPKKPKAKPSPSKGAKPTKKVPAAKKPAAVKRQATPKKATTAKAAKV